MNVYEVCKMVLEGVLFVTAMLSLVAIVTVLSFL